MKILCLNICGFGSGKLSKIGDFRRLLLREKPCIVALQETRLNNVDKNWVNLLWGSHEFDFIQKEKIGNSGGWKGRDELTFIVNVYGPHEDSNKLLLWSSLETLIGTHDAEWILCGDFNEVRDQSERKNCDFIERRARWFNEFIDRTQLIDVLLGGKKFTRICDNGIKFSKLDRFLVSERFYHTWGNVSALALERKLSDHCPIVLRDRDIDYGPKPIKIFDEWFDGEDSKKVVEKAWSLNVVGDRYDCVFRNKLKNVKHALKEWSKCALGSLDLEIEELKRKSCEWESTAETNDISDEDRISWLNTRKQWIEKEKVKANMAKEKSRVKWIKDGDENTKYFHSVFKRRHSKRNIRGLNIEGSWCEDPIMVKQAVYDHFKKQYEKRIDHKMRFADSNVTNASIDENHVSISPLPSVPAAQPLLSDMNNHGFGGSVSASLLPSNTVAIGNVSANARRPDFTSVMGLSASDPGHSVEYATGFPSDHPSDHSVTDSIHVQTPMLSIESAEFIESKFTESEVLEAIKECDCAKAPGPDGFKFKFFKIHWELIKDDLMNALHWFWDKCEISKGCNASFITLIPKNNDPLGLNEYRPISLIGCYYKILAKILSIHIRKVLPAVIGYEQSAYLKGRFILDGSLIANEAIEYLKRKRKKSLIFKVDFEKAFDSLSWDFFIGYDE
ncbi:uncharacterized protein [Rutidosis leptorrhynchoides]|uniref:uncharacterized protein n=1 Tax=Rutidosis leptorrhynchoides TaxID=125765 RepID=UPI003A98F600